MYFHSALELVALWMFDQQRMLFDNKGMKLSRDSDSDTYSTILGTAVILTLRGEKNLYRCRRIYL